MPTADKAWPTQGPEFDEQVDKTAHLLLSNNLNRPTLLRILALAEQGPMPLFDMEQQIQALPEFKTATQPPYFLIEWLTDTGALSFTEVDADGNEVSDEQKAGKTTEEIDDLVEDMIIDITPAGKETLIAFDPIKHLQELLAERPARFDTYIEVLQFLTSKRSYNDVDKLLRGRPILMDGREADDQPMQPSVFVDKLASAGGIVYTDGWIITPEGQALLDSLRP